MNKQTKPVSLITGISAIMLFALALAGCDNYFHNLVLPAGDRIISFKVPGQVRAAMISDDAVMITMKEGTNIRSLLPEVKVSPQAKTLPVTFNYLQAAFPSEDVLSLAMGMYTANDPKAYIVELIKKNRDFNIPILNIPIDFSAPVDWYVIAAQGNIRRYTIFVSIENGNNPDNGVDWPKLLGMRFTKEKNPELPYDAFCWIFEDNRVINATVKYTPDSDFSFELIPTFVILGDRIELDGNDIVSDETVIKFDAEPERQTKTLTLWRGGNAASYTLNVTFEVDAGTNGPLLEGLRFAKYDNPELVIDAVCRINESNQTVSVRAYYPMEMPYLSFALSPAFDILGERLTVDGADVRSSDETNVIQFNRTFGIQNKTLTVWRNGISKDYTLTITFEEDPDTVRSITDFRFVKQDNTGIAANAVASIINMDNTGTITVQVFYSGSPPSTLIPRFVSPGTLTVSGATQTTGASGHNFSSPVNYRVTSRNGQYVRTYTVKVTYVSLTDAAPRITSFRFSQNLNSGLVRDSDAEIRDDTGFVIIKAYYGGTFAPELLTPEFSSEGMMQVMGSMQISDASPQDFNRPIKYTVVHPVNPLFKRDYWVYTTMVQDSSSHAIISSFSFHPDDNPGLRDELTARIDQGTGKITVYAPIGSGVTSRTMRPRFTAAGQVNVNGTVQTSGVSGQSFSGQVTYTVTSANGLNRRDYIVDVRELASTMYVNHNAIGAGDGTSWENAFRYLQTACEAAMEFPADMPVEIWIASGTYMTQSVDDYFSLAPNTAYIGGFAGHETAKSQRNITANETVISGGLGAGLYAKRLFYSASEINGDLSFENLRLTGVKGQSGTCIYAVLDTASEIELTDCDFNNMEASGAGGAIYVRGGGAVISRCMFSTCTNGAVYVQGKSAKISNVGFTGCNNGNVVRLDCMGETEIKRVIVADCSGGAFYLGDNGNKTLETVTVSRGGQCLNVQNTTGYVSVNDLGMTDISGTGINLNGADGVKYFSDVTGRNINGNAVYCSASSGSFSITGNTFDNVGVISITDSSSSVSVLNTKITNSKGASAINISTNRAVVMDAITIDGLPNGNGITINNSGRTDITNSSIKNCVTTGNGGGISISGTGSTGISDVTITACKANSQGGGMYLACSGNVSVSKTTIDSVTLTASGVSGGGIYRTGGGLTVENSVIKNITGSGTECAGIYHNASANLEVTNLELQNIPGHGIYSTGSGVRKFSNIKAVTNIGGEYGIYSASMASGNFSVTDSTFTSCRVYCSTSGAVPITVTDTDIRNAKGTAGLYAHTGSGLVTIDWVNIEGVPNGRGIEAVSGNTVKVSNSIIKNCVTTGNGGGINISGAGSAGISEVTITACKAGSQGGGMYLACSGSVSVSKVTIDSASLTVSGVSGGGIYRSGGGLTVENSVIKNITGVGTGCSGIYHPTSANLEVTNLELQNITGHGIYGTGSGVRKFSNITAVTNIGGEYGVYSGSMESGSFSVTGSNFTSCRVYCSATGAVPVTVSDTNIRNAKGTSGLLALTGTGTVTVDWVTIDGVPDGRGIEAVSGNTVKVSNSIIKNCVSSGYGGGISISGAGSAGISFTTITACKAVSYGGGMYLTCSGDVSVSNIMIDGIELTATTEDRGFTRLTVCRGEGIYRTSGGLSLENSVIKNTTYIRVNSDDYYDANDSINAVYYSASANSTVSGLELQNISGNGIFHSSENNGTKNFSGITATNISGEYGIISVRGGGGSFSLMNSSFNSCGVEITTNGGEVKVTDTEIRNTRKHSRFEFGEDYYVDGLDISSGTGSVTIDRVTIDDVKSGIEVYSGKTLLISNSNISNCKNGSSHGGIYSFSSEIVRISNLNIINCEKSGIYLDSGYEEGKRAEISDTTIENVASSQYGAGIYSICSNLSITGCTIKNIESGCGIDATGLTNLTISGCTIRNVKKRGVDCWNYSILNIDDTTMELCLGSISGGAIFTYPAQHSSYSITNSRFINCTSQNNIKILDASYFTVIRNCTFTHDANLPNMTTSSSSVSSLFGERGGNFENCTFNNLKGNMPSGQNYLFNCWDRYPSYAPSGGVSGVAGSLYAGTYNLNLRNCTFNFNSGSAGLLALTTSLVNNSPNHIDNLLMDGVTINNNGGQQPLIWLDGNIQSGTFKFKPNNKYNGTLLSTQAAITGLGNSVIRLTNSATPVLAP